MHGNVGVALGDPGSEPGIAAVALPKLLQELDTCENCEHLTTTADGTQDTSEQIFKDPLL